MNHWTAVSTPPYASWNSNLKVEKLRSHLVADTTTLTENCLDTSTPLSLPKRDEVHLLLAIISLYYFFPIIRFHLLTFRQCCRDRLLRILRLGSYPGPYTRTRVSISSRALWPIRLRLRDNWRLILEIMSTKLPLSRRTWLSLPRIHLSWEQISKLCSILTVLVEILYALDRRRHLPHMLLCKR